MMYERPESESDYVFLRTAAPFVQLGTGSIYGILKKLEERAGIKKEERAIGSRTIRHHAAFPEEKNSGVSICAYDFFGIILSMPK